MAGGGVGEAMLIGAAMGAGTGAVTSAIDKKDPLQGALLGAVSGAAMGGVGSAVGGALTPAATEGANIAGTSLGSEAVNQIGQEGGKEALTAAMQQQASQELANVGTQQATQQAAQAAVPPPTQGGMTGWMQAGKDTGFAPGMTNAQAYGAGTAGGIMGISAAQNLPSTQPFPTENEDTYNGPLNYFKYDPKNFNVNTPEPRVYQARYGMADGGIASLGNSPLQNPISNPVYPQSQQQQTAFASSPQMPNSMRSAMASDYDTKTNPSFGTELPMGYANGGIASFGDGGFAGLTKSLQPGGWFGDMHGQLYGSIADATGVDFGGALGNITPGANQYHDKLDEERRKKEEEENAKVAAAKAEADKIARNTSLQSGMARGGIASLGGYSDGGQLLRGPGDGVSDSIPASIGGRQPARLADGEFVVPSRIVSELGNGSTDAGARRLYDMMDRVQARRSKTVGKGRVAKNTRAYQDLPV